MSKIHAAYLNMNYCFALKLNRLMLMSSRPTKLAQKVKMNGKMVGKSVIQNFQTFQRNSNTNGGEKIFPAGIVRETPETIAEMP